MAAPIEQHQEETQAVPLWTGQNLLPGLLQAIPLAIIGLDREGRVTLWNAATERMFLWPASECLGKPLPIVPADEQEAYRQAVDVELTGQQRVGVELRRLRKDGVTLHVQMWTTPVRNHDGHVIGVLGIFSDITERKRLEDRLRHAQKMEAIGRLAGGVAHDFNNVLTAISGYSDLLFESLEGGDPRRTYADEISRAADRASTLTRQLLAYSRQQVLAAQVLDLGAVVRGMEHMVRRLIGEDIELVVELDPHLRKVKADPGQLEQVILNLAVNARDAMPQGGRLTIQASNTELDEAYAWLHVDVQPGAYVCLAVGDSGCGMTEEVRSRLFEPFFTTKELGKGTGLGLSTVYGIVKQSEGHIDVTSVLGGGSLFKVYLPQVMEPAKQARPTMPMLPALGSETVLLVEDDEAVRTLARTVLRRHGYTVLEAEDGQQALELAAAQGESVQLLVSDVIMPHMNGHQLCQALRQRWPGLKVLFMSGYDEGAVTEPAAAFLQKPFTPEAFAHKVRALLDQAPVP